MFKSGVYFLIFRGCIESNRGRPCLVMNLGTYGVTIWLTGGKIVKKARESTWN